jgi:hypothetical protein
MYNTIAGSQNHLINFLVSDNGVKITKVSDLGLF